MKFDLPRPCGNCPFLKVGGVRLHAARIEKIAGGMLQPQGHTFACHKTIRRKQKANWEHCAGALIFAEKHGTATQGMRIAERIGLYDARKLQGQELVFDTIEEMVQAQ